MSLLLKINIYLVTIIVDSIIKWGYFVDYFLLKAYDKICAHIFIVALNSSMLGAKLSVKIFAVVALSFFKKAKNSYDVKSYDFHPKKTYQEFK